MSRINHNISSLKQDFSTNNVLRQEYNNYENGFPFKSQTDVLEEIAVENTGILSEILMGQNLSSTQKPSVDFNIYNEQKKTILICVIAALIVVFGMLCFYNTDKHMQSVRNNSSFYNQRQSINRISRSFNNLNRAAIPELIPALINDDRMEIKDKRTAKLEKGTTAPYTPVLTTLDEEDETNL